MTVSARNFIRRTVEVAVVWSTCTWLAACGTIVGNPKKPSGADPSSPAPAAIVYRVPDLGFSVPSSLTAKETSLLLGGDSGGSLDLTAATAVVGAGDRTLLYTWGLRLGRVLTQISALNTTINQYAANEQAAGNDGDVVTFASLGSDGKVSGRLVTLPAGGTYAYEATICENGQIVTDYQWSADNNSIAVSRDFAMVTDGVTDSFPLHVNLVATKGDDLTLDLSTQGQSSDDAVLPTRDGNLLTERAQLVRLASGELQLKATASRAASVPADGAYTADSYTIGRLSVTGNDGNGQPEYATEYAAYYDGYKILCRGGFNETAADLWHPTFKAGEARFCEGRPQGARFFASYTDVYTTLGHLQPIGLVKQADLQTVAFPASAACQ